MRRQSTGACETGETLPKPSAGNTAHAEAARTHAIRHGQSSAIDGITAVDITAPHIDMAQAQPHSTRRSNRSRCRHNTSIKQHGETACTTAGCAADNGIAETGVAGAAEQKLVSKQLERAAKNSRLLMHELTDSGEHVRTGRAESVKPNWSKVHDDTTRYRTMTKAARLNSRTAFNAIRWRA